MNEPSPPPSPLPHRLGTAMIAAAWIVALGLGTLLFNGWLERQHNPNQEIAGHPRADGVREVVLKRNRAGHYVATGRINGQPVEFLLDTGATTVSVPESVARRLHLPRGPAQAASTAAGVIRTYITRLARVELGDITLADVPGDINPHMGGNEVLLGMSFLKQLELVQRGNILTLRQYP